MPVGDGHYYHLQGLDAGLGLEFRFDLGEEGTEGLFGFAVEDRGVGEEAVAGSVLRGTGPFPRT
jgi:hypothetical protein